MDFGSDTSNKDTSQDAESDLATELTKTLQNFTNELYDKYLCKPPEGFNRKPDTVPFQVPHRKLLEKIEYQKPMHEPLTGFTEDQQEILRKRKKRYERKTVEEYDLINLHSKKKKHGVHFVETETMESEEIEKTDEEQEDEVILPHSKVEGVVKQKELINQMRNTLDGSFLYMVYAVPRSSELFTPYALRLVDYWDVDKKNFLTISFHGVTQYVCGEMSFTNLNKWEEEYDTYCRLMGIKSFFYFRMWKAFYTWHKGIIYEKYTSARTALDDTIFLANSHLKEAIINIRSMCVKMENSTFCDLSVIDNFYLFYFIEAQMRKLDFADATLKDFKNVVGEILNNGCHGALLAKGFVVDESVLEDKRGWMKGAKMSYIEQAKKKKFCARLSNFIILADYFMINMLHQFLVTSMESLLEMFKTHMQFLPSQEVLESDELSAILEPGRPKEFPQTPLIIMDVTITPSEINLDPTQPMMEYILEQLLNLWLERVLNIRLFIQEEIYKPFTNPMINGKMEDRLCGYGPPLQFYLDIDLHLQELNDEIFNCIKENYKAAITYTKRLDAVRQFYAEDVEKTQESIEEEKGLENIRKMCVRYKNEVEIIGTIADKQRLGLFFLQLENFKQTVLPQPKRLIEILEEVLPLLGKTKVDAMTEDVETALEYLNNTVPGSTEEFAKYLEFLEVAPEKADKIEAELDYCKELYDIMEEFQIPVSPEELSTYLGLSVTIGSFRNSVDRKTDDKANILKVFAEQMNKDISLLISETGQIKDKCLEEWLYDINSNIEEVLAFLNNLYEELQNCIRRAGDFKNYQKQFKMEVTRFDMLDEVMNDLKLRMLLWESVDSWAKTVSEWYSVPFSSLDVEDMNLITAKYLKNVSQLEKGLPKNLIVPKLKEDVEKVKDKLPVIGYLRNPTLKPRHWMKIEGILNHKFRTDEVVTLQILESMRIFEFSNEFMEVSAQASSEFGLEVLLKKIEEAWKTLEFIVMPHKDSKDVFILGSVEDVQAVLDESNINMTTIASSRHVGPIKPRVDEWLRFLDHFSKVLEEWLMCQQSWVYLEVIFSAPDIQRQLPNEAKMFLVVDKAWKELMRRTAKMPLAMEAASYPGILETLQKNNALLEQIMKCLEYYLETKRVAFPRFYFLSNDELLDILAQTKNPHAVQPHLRKCFDAIAKLEFGLKEGLAEDEAPVYTTDIMAMISPEGERVALGKGLKARGNVEDWLKKVEESMFISLYKVMKFGLADYQDKKREDWVLVHPNQVVLIVSQIMWCKSVHKILDFSPRMEYDMTLFERRCISDLNKLAGLVRLDLDKVVRKILIALITIDVHARDTISSMVKNKVKGSQDFEWLKMLRYYWQEDIDNCFAKMSSANYIYGYEYLGAGGVLVITPLTDRCYLCLMGALQLDLGGAPAGPAGTGKTETTKDLSKALAIQCVVFNCSEGLDYKIMGRFFAGLAQSGAWSCFDEFNRIDIEVLSVIAQQIITIRNAKAAKLKRFMFEGREIKLVQTCAAFITMNPGYAGRTELPDNLKALFRPISMMVPDYALIAEVTLYSEGFESSRILAHKMVQMYKLCSEQLSLQDHYDFGMRAVKSVLVMAGALKRASPDRNEDVVLICALRDSNLPKFLSDDAILFQGILGDLFPGVELPVPDYGIFEETIKECMISLKLQTVPQMIVKVIQLYETMIVRWGVMLVGPTGGGKSSVLNTLRCSLNKMYENGYESPYFQPVHSYIMNPKAVTAGELYGEVNPFTMEWRDGLMGLMVRTCVQATNEDHQWVICDGPVDAVWIENLNTVLDDNKMLCLANSERIKLTPYVHMVFEVMDLAQASPATVSRCGMVYIDSDELKWFPYVQSWIQKFDDNLISPDMKEFVLNLFEYAVENGFIFIKKNCLVAMHQVEVSKVTMVCKLMESIIKSPSAMYNVGEKSKVRNFLCQIFIFSYIWGVGGNLLDASRERFESLLRDQFDDHPDARIPPGNDLWSLYINIPNHRLEPWAKIIPPFDYSKDTPFFDMLVPTIDTVRFGHVMEKLVTVSYPVLYTGETGVGKSVIAKKVMQSIQQTGKFVTASLNFSAQTSSFRTQEMLELKLERKKKTLLGAPAGKKIVLFVDDVNMPKLETYGAQPPIELLRQFLDYGGLYDRQKLFWKDIKDLVITAACGPPGGGRNPLTPRFVRHFGMLFIPQPNEFTLKAIFKSILKGFLWDFANPVRDLADSMINASVEIYNRIAVDLLPTPAKSHYVFNLRDLSKCIQGILQADSGTLRDAASMQRLFYHECLRTFHDRLINKEDKWYFYNLMREQCSRAFGNQVLTLPEEDITDMPILFYGDFIRFGVEKEDRIYEEFIDITKLRNVLQDYLDDYNLATSKEMKLIFFMDAIEHCCRIARILRAERGNALLVGVGGMGKQSLTRLASHVNGYKCSQIELTRNYDHTSFFEDLRLMYYNAGGLKIDTVFLFTDNQIVQEEFLEDVNNILNSGEVPNLFEAEEMERAIIACRPDAKEAGIEEGNRDAIFDFFIQRVRRNLHLVLCMSPVGDAFRRRCRMFPSLVNCCTIDWFTKWPQEALLSVARNCFKDMEDKQRDNLSSICVLMHESVENMTERYYNEVRRHYYTTPSSYLDLLNLYDTMLGVQSTKITRTKDRVANGLQKIYETNDIIDVMKVELTEMEPKLVKQSAEVAALMKYLEKEQASADKVRDIVSADEAEAKTKAEETQALADEAQADLDVATPALEAAVKALESLNKNDINELKVFQKPPYLVKVVLEAVCLLLGAKQDWNAAKQVMGDVNFLKRLQEYDKDHISESTLKKLKVFIDMKEFVPEEVAKVSKVCKSICLWVRAIDKYAKVYKIVEPKRKKLAEAEKDLNQVMGVLREKQRQLADVEAQIANLQAQFNRSIAQQKKLEDSIAVTASRIINAGRLNIALGDEQIRWEQSVALSNKQLACVIGDVLLAAASVAYLGAFTSNYRRELVEKWFERCKDLKIPSSDSFNLISILADAYEIRMWNSCGLPRDDVSTENAILVTKGNRWPLMIDPQEQANRWIKQMEAGNKLRITKLTDSNFMRILESAIRLGNPVLLQEVGETLDPTLNPILLKQTFVVGGRMLMRLGDSDVEYDDAFKLYITTKLANPHYLPEICIQVTIVNFTVTPSGLEDQLLADVVRLERPDLEEQRTELIVRINNDKTQLKAIEDKILKLLFTSEGNILDDEELIETLNESKETSAIIAARLVEAESTEEKISIAREKYRPVSTRGSVLYFVVAQLAEIDPMYQYSLKYFTQVFCTVIETSEASSNLDYRLGILFREITIAVYTNISRGLFERHKLVFSFMLCVAVFTQNGQISDTQFSYLLRGPMGARAPTKAKPNFPTITDGMWVAVNYLADTFNYFVKLPDEITKIITVRVGDFTQVICVVPKMTTKSAVDWDKQVGDFDKLIILKTLQEEKLVFAITQFVKVKMGQAFIESPQISLNLLFQDTSNVTPLIFVLSTGSDPFSAFQRFAAEMNFLDRIQSISLGQGQGPVAEKLIAEAKPRGDWVFLQNCHLATSWMLSMEKIMLQIAEDPSLIHSEFRVFMSSMPSKAFPVAVLQNSVKVTNEPPKGLRANIKRAFSEMTEEFVEDHPLGQDWRTMLFGLCMFHAVIQERKKFGPLGWNIVYEFNDSDREFAFNTLKMFCAEGYIPWDALEYITGEITYGGRVTDYWDLRCLKTILKGFFAPHTLSASYTYSKSGVYYCPQFESLQSYRSFIDELPIIEEPEIFGMHENANIAFQAKETQSIVRTLQDCQPRAGGGTEGKSSDEIVSDLAQAIKEVIMEKLNPDLVHLNLLKRDDKGRVESLTTVLLQEIDRFNKLLVLLHSSLNNLQKAIKGLLVMSDALEEVFTAFMNNTVPKMWSAKSYPSLKSLGSWVHDLELRLDFINIWMQYGHPKSYWLSGFYFTQGFLTGTLQTHARKYDVPIDQLKYNFIIQHVYVDQDDIKKAHDEQDYEVHAIFRSLTSPKDGVLIHGLFLDAGKWDNKNMVLIDAEPGEINPPLPAVHFLPTVQLPENDTRYVCPLYKTSVRAGTLSTTGHSTNFILAVLLPTKELQSYWILKGTALLTQLTD